MRRPTLSERVKRLEDVVATLAGLTESYPRLLTRIKECCEGFPATFFVQHVVDRLGARVVF